MTLKLKSELERLERLKIIEKQEAPTKWVSHMVVVWKPNNHIRICLDPNPLNKAFSPGGPSHKSCFFRVLLLQPRVRVSFDMFNCCYVFLETFL